MGQKFCAGRRRQTLKNAKNYDFYQKKAIFCVGGIEKKNFFNFFFKNSFLARQARPFDLSDVILSYVFKKLCIFASRTPYLCSTNVAI